MHVHISTRQMSSFLKHFTSIFWLIKTCVIIFQLLHLCQSVIEKCVWGTSKYEFYTFPMLLTKIINHDIVQNWLFLFACKERHFVEALWHVRTTSINYMLHPLPYTIPQEVVIFLNFECFLMFVCLFLQVFNANFGLFKLIYILMLRRFH